MPEMRGGCLCGQVRYSATAEPALVAVCHCKNCQRSAGSPFALIVAIPEQALSVHGNLKAYHDTADSGRWLKRNFCPECGSPVISYVEMLPGMVIVRGGSLDDTSWVRPTMQIWCDSAQPWVQLGGEMQSLPKNPG